MTANRPAKKAALGRARSLREQFRDRGEFTQAEFRSALSGVLNDLASEAFEGFVDHIAEVVDRDTPPTEKSDPYEGRLLWDLEGEYKFGDGRRIAKRLATIDHIERALAINDRNVAAVMGANVRMREEYLRLKPHWDNGVTKSQAIDAYLAEHPEEDTDPR